MTNLDLFWKSNKVWYERDGFKCWLKDDASQEARESWERYQEQVKEAEERGAI